MTVELRRASAPAELQALWALLVDYELDLPSDLRHGPVPRLDQVERDYRRDRSAAFLAYFEGLPGGCVGLTCLTNDTAVLQRLYVRPAFRGRRAARALVREAVSFARAQRFERVVLDTDAARLAAAFALYRSLGFVPCEPFAPVGYASPTYLELRLR